MVKKETAQTYRKLQENEIQKTEFPQIKYSGPIALAEMTNELKQTSHGETKKKIREQ